MKFFIPTVGDQFTVTSNWEVTLIHSQNYEFYEFLREQNPSSFPPEDPNGRWSAEWQYEKGADGKPDYNKPKSTIIVIPSGVVVQVSSFDIKVNTRSQKGPTSLGAGVTFKLVSGLSETKRKFTIWVKLDEVNRLNCEPIVVDERAKVKRIKKPEILKMIGAVLDAHHEGKFNFNSYNKKPDWLTDQIEHELARLASWFSKSASNKHLIRGYEFGRLFGGDSSFERSGENNLVCTRKFNGTVLPLGWRSEQTVDASRASMHVVTDDDVKITKVHFEGI